MLSEANNITIGHNVMVNPNNTQCVVSISLLGFKFSWIRLDLQCEQPLRVYTCHGFLTFPLAFVLLIFQCEQPLRASSGPP